jgi:phytoene synthase
VYAFARGADDIADEPGPTPDTRLALLDEWAAHLHQPPRNAVFRALADTRARFGLPATLFEDLLSAFRQDVVTARYETWDDVMDYCRRSANPVGRIVLRLAGYDRPDLDRWSDAVCTALQLTNFWQDLAVDWSRGRLYVPAEVWRPAGASPTDLDRRAMTDSWRTTLADCVAFTRRQFTEGRAVCDAVRGRLRYELRATWLGGQRILDRLEDAHFDVFRHRPTLTRMDAVVIAWNVVSWSKIPNPQSPVPNP